MHSERTSAATRKPAGIAYGLMGLPLAFATLPLYVVMPHQYATGWGLSLTQVGVGLMLVRLVDASAEPGLGQLSDRMLKYRTHTVLWMVSLLALVHIVTLAGLFRAPTADPSLAMLALCLLLACLSHSLLTLIHQAWGVRLGGDAVERSRVVAWREGSGLVGVLMASALSVAWGHDTMLLTLAATLALGWLALWQAPEPSSFRSGESPPPHSASLLTPLKVAAFRRLLAVFMCNGIAGAIPSVLMLFFAQDRLQASPQQIAGCLGLYFVSGALTMPAWLRGVHRWGLEATWQRGMLLAVACFVWTATLDSGDIGAFAVICALSGIALGADLTIPGALLSRLTAEQGAQGHHEGTYLGWWNLATKFNLAWAAGATLPALQLLGYEPGSQSPSALQHLTWIYALLPCVLKLVAAWLLHKWLMAGRIPLNGVQP